MKRLIFIILFVLSAIALVFASDGVVKSFSAESGGDFVTVKWATDNESNVKLFEIERSTADNNFKKIHQKLSQGKSSTYSYLDEEAFMKQDGGSNPDLKSQSIYSYRIKVVYKDNSTSFTDEAYVAHKPSSIRRTWGMIKEMFR